MATDVTGKKEEANQGTVGSHPAQVNKQLNVCEVCSAMLVVDDAESRVNAHLTGKLHVGFLKIREVPTFFT